MSTSYKKTNEKPEYQDQQLVGPRTIGMKGSKPKNFKQSMLNIIHYIKQYYITVIIALVLSTASSIMMIIGPDKIREITDLISAGIQSGIDLNQVAEIGLFLGIIYSLSYLFNYLQGFLMATVSQKTSKRLRMDLNQKINRLPLRYFDNTTYGNILSRISNDVDLIGTALNQSTASLIVAITLFLGSTYMMIVTNWILAIAAIGSSIFGFILMFSIVSKSQKHFVNQQKQLGVINGYIEENFTGQQIIKSFSGEENSIKQFDKYNEELYSSAWKSQFFSGLMVPLMMFISNFGYVVVALIGSYLVAEGQIEFGVVVAFMLYIRLFTQPLSQFAQIMTSLQSAGASSERIFELLGEEELIEIIDNNPNLLDIQGDIRIENMSFGYDKEKRIINDLSVHIKSGQKVAIVGPTGAGKTTIVNLLMKFYSIDSGKIYLDNTPYSNIKRSDVHHYFGMVLQDSWIFDGTVYQNIKFNNEDITIEYVQEVCKAIGIDHFIKTLPQGYNTVINENISISQGEMQLLTIARAFIQNPPILIFDEATSTVDTRTEKIIQSSMDKLMHNRTSIVIAHRLSTIVNSDLILVLNQGDVIEQGTHQELLGKKGFYYDLYQSQFA